MEHGQVRAILGRHALGHAAASRPSDPTLLVPAAVLRRELEGRSEAEQRALAQDYVALWARTFRTLARHLRGRPERALALFAEEVYPFLRGDRRASRVERLRGREARVLLPVDLPAAYHCGLLEAFVGLSGATATAQGQGNGVFAVAFQVAPADRLARAAQTAATLRLPLLAAAALAALTGILLASDASDMGVARAAAVLVGALAAQAAAGALVDLRQQGKPGGPLRPALPTRGWLLAQAGTAGAVALAAGAWLAVTQPAVLLFAGAGLLAGLLLPRLLGRGFGPFAAVLLYGPLIGLGAFHAFEVGTHHLQHALLGVVGLPVAFLAGALLFLGDLADRPLDEAGGRRTLAVTLPRRPQAWLYAGLLAASLLALAAFGVLGFWPHLVLLAAVLVIPVGFLVRRVDRELDDPRGLAPARVGTFALLVGVGLAVLLTLLLGVAG
jgi:1,4-dihydroxy-2-naphthoate octaprenyltransferase